MAPHQLNIRLSEASYELVLRESKRRGVTPDALAEGILRAALPDESRELKSTLCALADVRARLPEIDGLALATQARADLRRRCGVRAP